MTDLSNHAWNHRARRAARKAGLVAVKSRARKRTVDNLGGLQLVDPTTNLIVAGERFDLTPEEVIQFCEARKAA